MDTTEAQLDLVTLMLKRWRVVLCCALLGIAASILYIVVSPNWYEASVSVVPSHESKNGIALSLASKLPDFLDNTTTDVQRIRAVFTSESVTDKVIDKFSLMDRYSEAHRELARKALWTHCWTSADRKAEVVSLTCEDQDPKVAMDMASYFGEVGNQVLARVSVSSAREERKFLEAQVVQAKKDVDDASRELREFQEKNKIIDLPEQSKAVISAMASIEGELMSKQLELSYLSSFSSHTESSVIQLQQQIGIMQEKLQQLEANQKTADSTGPAPVATTTRKDGGKSEFFPGAMTVPALRFQLEQLMRQQKIKETLYFLMTQRYEMAKIDEARDTSSFQILDSPTLPTFRSRPRRKLTVAVGFLAGLVLSASLIGVPPWVRQRRTKKLA